MTNQTNGSNDNHECIQVPAFELEDSVLISAESREAIKSYRSYQRTPPAPTAEPQPTDPASIRQQAEQRFYQGPIYQSLIQRYQATVTDETLGNIPCKVFTPEGGIAPANQQRVLINLHGGAFENGSHTNIILESLPVAALGQIKVIGVDYRKAPEYQFPAASDDVEAVYSALLKDYAPENIGIYGASAGAVLSTQILVRLQQHKLPLPGAVALLAGGASKIDGGDSLHIGDALAQGSIGFSIKEGMKLRYYQGADTDSPEVTPSQSDSLMQHFPPTLLATSTRDFCFSQTITTHRQLLRLGVKAELHVWEGLDHVFHYNPALPETDELHRQVVNFLIGNTQP